MGTCGSFLFHIGMSTGVIMFNFLDNHIAESSWVQLPWVYRRWCCITEDVPIFRFLQAFWPFFHNFPWAAAVGLALEKISTGSDHSRVTYYHFYGLWISVIMSIFYKKKLLWWGMRATLICDFNYLTTISEVTTHFGYRTSKNKSGIILDTSFLRVGSHSIRRCCPHWQGK